MILSDDGAAAHDDITVIKDYGLTLRYGALGLIECYMDLVGSSLHNGCRLLFLVVSCSGGNS